MTPGPTPATTPVKRELEEIEEAQAFAVTLPRALIADGHAGPLAEMWIVSRRRAVGAGRPAFARHEMNATIADGLFHARRARQLVRGLEAGSAALEAEAAGLKAQALARGSLEAQRISRLLILSEDGSPRFFKEAAKLEARFANRLAVLLLECDQETLGAAAFGRGKQARALLLVHKEAVIRFLLLLDRSHAEVGIDHSK